MSNSGHPKDHGHRRGLMLVLSSPSGAGKTTLAKKLIEEFDDVNLSVSATTRPPRPGENDGKDYHFRSVDEFHHMIERREFLEWAHVFDKYYGTPKADTVAKLLLGHSDHPATMADTLTNMNINTVLHRPTSLNLKRQ